ncbi:unnamed protein product [Anisakis simplex]|uniref:SET domain-containing protein n=1 Tax=Anisakis simplex TaxID=6269 RepID=A0A0M3JC98_ANISI|nr:unnamed protein product [Anisakis simplex]
MCDAPKVDAIKGNDGLAVMFVTQIVRGLVSLRSFDIYEPVVYVCGRVSLPSECPGREKPGAVLPFVILYSDLYLDGESTPTNLCIDMRKMGSVARFARRSCHPNVKLQHFFCGGKLHIIASATEKVERGDEVSSRMVVVFFCNTVMIDLKLLSIAAMACLILSSLFC